MDVLTDALKIVRMKSSCWGRSELSAPWGIRHDGGGEGSMFHYVIRGGGWLDVEGHRNQIPLAAGDLVMVTLRKKFALRDEHSSPTRRLVDLFPERAGDGAGESGHRPEHPLVEHGGGGRPTSFIFGVFHFDEERANPLLAALPDVLHIRNDHEGAAAGIADTLALVVRETSEQRPGADTVIRHLTDVLFIQIVRAFIAGLREEDQEVCNAIGANWLRALSDPQIMKALTLIHEHPGKSWTVASLAAEIGMSRSSFATRFTESVGEPPLAYVTRWRLLRAVESMRRSGGAQSLAEIALATGYESDAAFSKAFKRLFGHSPGAFRRAMKASLVPAGEEAVRQAGAPMA